jgi:hypothetical protein
MLSDGVVFGHQYSMKLLGQGEDRSHAHADYNVALA